MNRSSALASTLAIVLALPPFAAGRGIGGNDAYPPGYLDYAKMVGWADVKALSRAESAASQALIGGRLAQAKILLLNLRNSPEDSVLVRKGLLDVDPGPVALKARLKEIARPDKKGQPLRHSDALEMGYAVAMLLAAKRGRGDVADVPISDAVGAVRKVLHDDPSLAEQVAAGEILAEIGNVGEMRSVLKQAAKRFPSRAGVQLAYAWALIHIGDRTNPAKPQEALGYALRAIREAPGRAEAYLLAGNCYSGMGDQKRADAQYREFVQRGDPESRLVKLIRADLESRPAPKPD